MVACAIVSGQGLRLKVKGIRKTGIVEDRFKGLRFKWRQVKRTFQEREGRHVSIQGAC